MNPLPLLFALVPQATSQLELVESAPLETTLDHADLRNADTVWLEMIARAKSSFDCAQFYVSDAPGSRFHEVVRALEAAAQRGVKVRVLAEEKFHKTYPETLDRWSTTPGFEVRRFDVSAHFGGVLHAKYFVVDGREVFVGSQNFDWRSLEHIVELGLRIEAPRTAEAFQAVFDADWRVAGGEPLEAALAPLRELAPPRETLSGAVVSARFSPLVGVASDVWWDLPLLVERLERAEKRVRIELLTYKMVGRDKQYFAELENALRRAAARGVRVQLLVADWGKRAGTIEGLQSLEPLPNVEVKLATIPPHSSGHIPFGRVIHAKYMTVDGSRVWLGTSNWERDYFEESRNASVFVDDAALATRLERFFDELWSSPYAYAVDPSATYEVPKFGER
ncbi:MAG: phospholipase [Planctomycetes bacterium]|nr:phospholipase [Planctomycetota bacterium]